MHISRTLSCFLSLFIESRFWSSVQILFKICCHLLVQSQVLEFYTAASFSSSDYEVTINVRTDTFQDKEQKLAYGYCILLSCRAQDFWNLTVMSLNFGFATCLLYDHPPQHLIFFRHKMAVYLVQKEEKITLETLKTSLDSASPLK